MAYGHPDGPRIVPGAVVDQSRWEHLKQRAREAWQCYQPLPPSHFRRSIPAAACAPPPAPAVKVVFCECGSQADVIPPGICQCRRCRRQWRPKP